MTICKRCVAWVLSAFFMAAIILPGCDSAVTFSPDFDGASYDAPSFEVIKGTLNGVDTPFRASQFFCEPNGFYVYSDLPSLAFVDSGLNYRVDVVNVDVEIVTVLNADDTQVDCRVELVPHVDVVKSIKGVSL